MYTYNFCYFGFPVDDYTQEQFSDEANELIEQARESDDGWLSSNYHGGDDEPLWIGIDGPNLPDVSSRSHLLLSGYKTIKNDIDLKNYELDFEKVWSAVPEIIQKELTKIYGAPDFWVSEASS